MTKQEFKEAFRLAHKSEEKYDWPTLDIFSGCGLPDFKSIFCTLWAVSRILRYQCLQFDGSWNDKELNEMAYIARHKFQIID